MKAPYKTKAGSLFGSRINAREAAILDHCAKQMLLLTYDFSQDAGAVGTIDFQVNLPANAVITGIWADVVTAVTSGGSATLQLKAGVTSIMAAIGYADTTHGVNATGVVPQVVVASAPATALKLAAASDLTLVIAGAALTAGRVIYVIDYFVSTT